MDLCHTKQDHSSYSILVSFFASFPAVRCLKKQMNIIKLDVRKLKRLTLDEPNNENYEHIFIIFCEPGTSNKVQSNGKLLRDLLIVVL